MLPELPDFVRIIRRASTLLPECHPDYEFAVRARKLASRHLAILMAEEDPLGADHGHIHPRASDCGRCSLEYVADNLKLLDLTRADDNQWVLDNGTLMGAWLACLLKAGAYLEEQPFDVHLEIVVEYHGVPGHVDAFIEWHHGENGARAVEPVEFKSTPSTAQLKPPDVGKLPQALQAGLYGGAMVSERFTVIRYGYNVGDDKEGTPHPKMLASTYATKDYLPLVDEEIARLAKLALVSRDDIEAAFAFAGDDPIALADGDYCKTCRFSRCAKNRSPMRYSLV